MSEQFPNADKGFDESYKDKIAECDGGEALAGTRYAGRQEFRGRLTGDYLDVGDPPSRWYLMVELTLKPKGFEGDAVWCLSGNTFLGPDGPTLRRP
jgi:hypothetical protein